MHIDLLQRQLATATTRTGYSTTETRQNPGAFCVAYQFWVVAVASCRWRRSIWPCWCTAKTGITAEEICTRHWLETVSGADSGDEPRRSGCNQPWFCARSVRTNKLFEYGGKNVASMMPGFQVGDCFQSFRRISSIWAGSGSWRLARLDNTQETMPLHVALWIPGSIHSNR